MENLKIKIQLAVDLYKFGDFEKAEGICNQLISENPKNVWNGEKHVKSSDWKYIEPAVLT